MHSILLLQRTDTDTTLTDLEGNTAFDLYSATVRGARPTLTSRARVELLTWGTNRNAALGHPDGDDRAHPEAIALRRSERAGGKGEFRDTVAFRLRGASAVDVRMSRLHTGECTALTRTYGKWRGSSGNQRV
jgi:hypothetical protein